MSRFRVIKVGKSEAINQYKSSCIYTTHVHVRYLTAAGAVRFPGLQPTVTVCRVLLLLLLASDEASVRSRRA